MLLCHKLFWFNLIFWMATCQPYLYNGNGLLRPIWPRFSQHLANLEPDSACDLTWLRYQCGSQWKRRRKLQLAVAGCTVKFEGWCLVAKDMLLWLGIFADNISRRVIPWCMLLHWKESFPCLIWLGTFWRPPSYRRHLHRYSGEGEGPSPELWWMSGKFLWIWLVGSPIRCAAKGPGDRSFFSLLVTFS